MLLSRRPCLARAKPLLGTFVHLALFSNARDDGELSTISSACFERIAAIQRMMSFFEEDSEVSLINRTIPCGKIRASQETIHVLRLAQELYDESCGAFDVMQRSRPLNRDAKLTFHHDGSISRTHDALIDLGGIAKGFAVDEAVKTLSMYDDLSGIINAGGDMYFFGEEPLPFAIRSPFNDGRYFQGEMVSRCAVATSVFHPPEGPVSVTVLAKSCMIADALTKVVYGSEAKNATRILDLYGARQISIR